MTYLVTATVNYICTEIVLKETHYQLNIYNYYLIQFNIQYISFYNV